MSVCLFWLACARAAALTGCGAWCVGACIKWLGRAAACAGGHVASVVQGVCGHEAPSHPLPSVRVGLVAQAENSGLRDRLDAAVADAMTGQRDCEALRHALASVEAKLSVYQQKDAEV